MGIRLATVLGVAAVLGACGMRTPTLEPVPGTNVLPAPAVGAMASDAGVTLEAQTNAWRGVPSNLEQEITPVLVTITNDGTEPLRIRYADFALVAASGREYRALPPFSIDETVSEPVDDFGPYDGFAVAPYLSPYYPGLRAYRDPFFFDRPYYDRYYPAFVEISLPTGDMIQKALPEGVVMPGGRVSGFLYFEDLDPDLGRVDLKHALRTPSGRTFGQIAIPFQVR